MSAPTELCYICCEPGADDRDHVIPVALFEKPRPSDLLTLPAHHKCHDQLDEEYFRLIVAGQSSRDNQNANKLWEGKIKRSVQRSAPLQASLRSALLDSVNLVSPGGIWLGKVPGIRFDRDRFYPTLEKIVRGLYLSHTKNLLPRSAGMKWAIMNEPPKGQMLEIFQQSTPGLFYPGVFDCKYGIASDDKTEMTVWWLRFYEGLVMRCFTKSNRPCQASAGASN